MDASQDLVDLIIPFSDSKQFLGNSSVADYIYRYLEEQGAESCIVEREYIDKDFLIDYSKYYSRSFNKGSKRLTTRVHFFSCHLTHIDLERILSNGNKEDKERDKKYLNDNYLGFTILKPINDFENNPLIGRTLLKTYSEEDGDARRVFLKDTYDVSLFGIPLTVESLPYQTQDSIVGGCATIACWVAQYPLSKLFGTPIESPYEITERSISVIVTTTQMDRDFPSKGLYLPQMKNCFIKIGLDTEWIVPHLFQGYGNSSLTDDIVADIVRAYISMGLPVIATIELNKPLPRRKIRHRSSRYVRRIRDTLEAEYHAVVISGYRHSNGKITELYLHDDGIGPYCRTLPIGNFSKWRNEWISRSGYESIHIYSLLIPIYPKLRLIFPTIYRAYLKAKREFEAQILQYFKNQDLNPDLVKLFDTELFLTDIKKYKSELFESNFQNKISILRRPMPRFVWVIRWKFNDEPIVDLVYDGTSEVEIVENNQKTGELVKVLYDLNSRNS